MSSCWVREDLEHEGVGGHRGHVVGPEPLRRLDGQAGRGPGVGDEVAPVRRQVHHLAGADQHDVAGRHLQAGQRAGRVEVVGHDRVARLEHVEALGPGHVEEHAPTDDRAPGGGCRTRAAPSSDTLEAG